MRSLKNHIPHQKGMCDQNSDDEVGKACERRYVYSVWYKNLKMWGHLEDLCVDVRIMFQQILHK